MSTVTMPSGDRLAPTGPLIKTHGWVQIGVLAALFIALFWHVLFKIYGMGFDENGEFGGRGYAWRNSDWSHAFIVPLISLYFISQHRQELAKAVAQRMKTSWLGMALMVVGIVAYALAIHPIRNDTAKGYAMILTLFGLIWFLTGWSVARLFWFPIFYLVFAIKLPGKVWSAIAEKLQDIAAQVSGMALMVFGRLIDLEAEVEGNTIKLWHQGKDLGDGLNIAEACSGLRMLMTFIALGVAVAYLADRPWWVRLIMVLLTVPIAILVNVGRVTTLGMIYPYWPEAAAGDFHILIGMLMLIPAGLLFLLIGWVFNKMFIEEDETDLTHADKPAKGAGA